MKNIYTQKNGNNFIKTGYAETPKGGNETFISYGKQSLFLPKNITNTYQKMVRGNIAHHFHFYSLLLF
jgi:hypothetical protein